ncbi:MAG: hypothetical protein OEZ02_02945 [Anaerolineae bacterium]|nr:hypothetical protein [Anaerolineae bacterium]
MLETWKGLYNKELRLNARFSSGWLMFSGAVAVWAVILAYSFRAGSGLLFFIIVLHGAYLPLYVLASLNKDWRQTAHLWLHSPQSGAALLSAKLGAGLATMLVSLGLLSLTGLWTSSVELELLDEPWGALLLYGFAVVVKVCLLALYGAVWVAALWMVRETLRYSLRKARRWALLGLLLAAFVGTELLFNLRWVGLRLPLPDIQYDVPGLTPFQHVYLGSSLVYLVLVVGVFTLTSYILDKWAEG